MSEKILKELKMLKRRASTRTSVYRYLAEKYEVTEAYVRLLASRAGLTSREHSLMCAFSEEEEDALFKVCIAYARRGEAFTIPDFITIASFFKGKTEKCVFFFSFLLSYLSWQTFGPYNGTERESNFAYTYLREDARNNTRVH